MSDAYYELQYKKIKETKTQAADYSDIGQSALAILRYLGFVFSPFDPWTAPTNRRENELPHESLEYWVRYADEIQAIFLGREARTGLPRNLTSIAGSLQVVLTYKPDGVSMQLLPDLTGGALIYHAAQMVTNGTKLLNCEYCHSPLFKRWRNSGPGQKTRRREILQR
jgi:hypothetical protein